MTARAKTFQFSARKSFSISFSAGAMADISDVMGKLGELATSACFPNGASSASIIAKPIFIMEGWPKPQTMDAALGAGQVLVNIFAIGGTSGVEPQVFEKLEVIVPAVHGLSASIDTATGQTVTISGAPTASEYLTLTIDGQYVYSYISQPGDTAAAIAATLASQVAADYPSAHPSGTTVTVPGSFEIIVRIGSPATMGRLLHRQSVQIRIVIWANNPVDRSSVAAAIDVQMKRNLRLYFADTSEAILTYQGTNIDDNLENTGEYRRDLIYIVSYGTLYKLPAYEVTSVQVSGPTIGLELDTLGIKFKG